MTAYPDRPVRPVDPDDMRSTEGGLRKVPNPDREMDNDRAGDVRPADGRTAAGAGSGPTSPAPAPYANEGELVPEARPTPPRR